MRLTALILLVVCLLQGDFALGQTITLSYKNTSLQKIFTAINKQTGYQFFYNDKILKHEEKLSINVKNMPLEEVLELCFKNIPVTYNIVGNTIILKEKETGSSTNGPPLTNTVSGFVTETNGKPMSGASVVVKGSQKGTASNEQGFFSVEAKEGDILSVSYIGFVTEEIKVASKQVNIKLDPDSQPLEAMLVGGNVIAIKRMAEVSSVTVIDAKTLEQLPVQNVEQIYRGLVPGTNNIQPTIDEVSQVRYASGSVSIRGASGFSGFGILKVYVDGVEYSEGSLYLNTIDKNNIERIEVARGPSAVTLYGSGANGGIIQIFTKKPVTGKTFINLTTSAGWQDSKWQSKKPFQQVYALDISRGFRDFSYRVGANLNNSESYMPDGRANQHAFYGSARYQKNKIKMTFDGRYYKNNFIPARNALYDDSTNVFYNKPGLQLPDTTHGYIQTNTLGFTTNYQPTNWWTHNLIAGWNDIYYLRETNLDHPPLVKSWMSLSTFTLRYNNNIILVRQPGFNLSLLSGIDYTYSKSIISKEQTGRQPLKDEDETENTGIFGQLNPSFKNRYFFSLALRYEINRNFVRTLSPRIGFTTNYNIGNFIFKPRVSWGKGITPANSGVRSGIGSTVPNPDLKPQQQTGWDFGWEGYTRNDKLRFEVVYYDNILTDAFYTKVTAAPQIYSQVVNAGKIHNYGWEFSTMLKVKNFHISGNFSISNSILKEPLSGTVSPKDYPQPGEQMIFVSKYLGGLTLAYAFPKLFGKADRLSISLATTYMGPFYAINDARYGYEFGTLRYTSNYINYGIRFYMIEYGAVTKFNFNADYIISRGVQLFCQIRNIGNNTVPEYSNTSPTIGRGWLMGFRFNFSGNK